MTSQDVLLIVHIAAVIAAIGTGFVHTALLRVARTGGRGAQDAAEVSLGITKRYTLPALLIAALAGVALVLNSNDAFLFGDTWVSAAMSIVILMFVLTWFVTLPAQKALLQVTITGGGAGKETKRVEMATGIFNLGFLIVLVLMVWKP